ncbi:hypothetical protein FBU30_003138 [Linnemannia zychae]|nr:hypothetical protein FBU30_003138 [Linnemannia zychae]
MKKNPLDIPEILTLIGSFLPLWTYNDPEKQDLQQADFQPKTLLACLLVSKLWYRALLPILWYTFRSNNVNEEERFSSIIRRNSVHIKVLHAQSTTRLCDFDSINLVHFHVFLNESVGTPSGSLYAKQLLRSSPGLKRLLWNSDSTTDLNPDDFVSLKDLEYLCLDGFRCNNRTFKRALKTVSGSLIELKIGKLVFMDESSDAGDLSLLSIVDEDPELTKVVKLELSGIYNPSISDMIKYCPNVKIFKFTLCNDNANILYIASAFWRHRRDIETFILDAKASLIFHLHTLLQVCSTSGLCRLHLYDLIISEDVVSGILAVSSTLEELILSGFCQEDIRPHRLLVECTRLQRCSFCVYPEMLDIFIKNLRSERWRCQQTLQELRLDACFDTKSNELMVAEKTEVENLLASSGWAFEGDDENSDNDVVVKKIFWVKQLLEMMQVQELGALQIFAFRNIKLRRMLPTHCH